MVLQRLAAFINPDIDGQDHVDVCVQDGNEINQFQFLARISVPHVQSMDPNADSEWPWKYT